MKKGDIVTLRGHVSDIKQQYYTKGSNLDTLNEFKKRNDIPTELTIERVGSITVCCSTYPTLYFEEIGDVAFEESAFEVVLQAGEPDVEQLMKESEETKRMLIGF